MTPIRKGGGANPVEIYGEGAFKQRVYLGADLVWQKADDECATFNALVPVMSHPEGYTLYDGATVTIPANITKTQRTFAFCFKWTGELRPWPEHQYGQYSGTVITPEAGMGIYAFISNNPDLSSISLGVLTIGNRGGVVGVTNPFDITPNTWHRGYVTMWWERDLSDAIIAVWYQAAVDGEYAPYGQVPSNIVTQDAAFLTDEVAINLQYGHPQNHYYGDVGGLVIYDHYGLAPDPMCDYLASNCSAMNLTGVRTQVFAASGVWVCPSGVTEATVECWAGGGGTGSPGSGQRFGGGGGGAFAKDTVVVSPLSSYNIVVGAGGAITGSNGGDSYFQDASTVMAKGGTGCTSPTGAQGGPTPTSVGATKYGGGAGADASDTYAGGGGGGAGSVMNGSNGITYNGGRFAYYLGGGGGDGARYAGIGQNGRIYGAGGGGSWRSGGPINGTAGAEGLVRVTWRE